MCGSGVALIVGSVLLIDASLPFPGLLALPPCLGAALIILAGRDGDTLTGRLLSMRPVVFVGVISYSLYLWHWPIVVFQKNSAFLMRGLSESSNKVLIIAASMLAAGISWRLIEQPFRAGKYRPSKPVLLKFAAGSTVSLILLGTVTWAERGFPGRYTERELEIARVLDYDAHDGYRADRCYLTPREDDAHFAPECLALSDSKKNYLLLGDSHAAEIWYGLHEVARDKNFLQANASDCFPTLEHAFGEAPRCAKLLDDIMRDFLLHHPVDNVLLAARWKRGQLNNIGATIDWMTVHNMRVTLVGPSALYDVPLPRLMVSALRNSDTTLPQRHFDRSMVTLDAELAELAEAHGAAYISMLKLMCSGPSCTIQNDQGLPLIFDREHFTTDGSMVFARKLQARGGI